MNKNVGTVCVHGKKQRRNVDNTGAVSFPIYQSATFVHPAFGESTGFDYSRLQNPTREELERVVNDLEEGVDALAFSTGMAAVTTLLDILEPGDHIVATDDLYGGTIRLMENICKKNGIKTTFVETDKVENVEKAIGTGSGTTIARDSEAWTKSYNNYATALETEIHRADATLPRAIRTFMDMEKAYPAHLMLAIIYDDYIRLRNNLSTYMNASTQTYLKAYNAQDANKR